jgi:hypothetical protein
MRVYLKKLGIVIQKTKDIVEERKFRGGGARRIRMSAPMSLKVYEARKRR